MPVLHFLRALYCLVQVFNFERHIQGGTICKFNSNFG